jgi:hypothetical protein
MPNYSYNDSPMTPNVETISRLPPRVLQNPPLPPVNPNFTPLADMPAQAATPVSAMAPQTQAPGAGLNPMASVWSFLQSLFGGQGAVPSPGPAQGMRGLLQTPVGRGAPGTNSLGNPVGRF